MRLFLYYNTLRHLKAIQWKSLFWAKLKLRSKSVRISPLSANLMPRPKRWKEGQIYPGKYTGEDHFDFLNAEHHVSLNKSWSTKETSHLWEFNLHYFNYILDPNCSIKDALKLIESWIQIPVSHHTARHPYTTSLRIVNWIRFHFEREQLPQHAIDSLATQALHLSKNLETHLLANHYFTNAKALLFSGLFIECRFTDDWIKQSIGILEKELVEQFLPDGGHFERSPMYHRTLTLDLLDIFNALSETTNPSAINLRGKVEMIAQRALSWMQALTHKESSFPLFGDSTFGIAPSDNAIFDYAKNIGLSIPPRNEHQRLTHLPQSGFVAAKRGSLSLIADIGSIVADYQPGHAHADLLGFELAYKGDRLFVDTGVDRYGYDSERHRQRSTISHCCLSIDKYNSHEIWSGFRVARRGKVTDSRITQSENSIEIKATHNGYFQQKIAGPHTRTWNLANKSITISDQVELLAPSNIFLNFIVHSDFKVELVNETTLQIRRNANKESVIIAYIDFSSKMKATLAPTPICHQFGASSTGTRISLNTQLSNQFSHKTRITFTN